MSSSDGGLPQTLNAPKHRMTTGWRGVWFASLVSLPRELRKVQLVRRHLRQMKW